MTVKEAQRNLADCEEQVSTAYRELYQSIRSVGKNAAQTAAMDCDIKTAAPLLLCVIGLLMLSGPWYLGIVLIIAGGFLSYILHARAKVLKQEIRELQRELEDKLGKYTDL